MYRLQDRVEHLNVTDTSRSKEQLYIAQLRSCIGDLLAVGRPRSWWWRDIWDQRVKRAEYLLRRRVKS